MLRHHINLSPNNIIYKILKNKQKNKSWACPAASGTQDCTYGEIFANKIKLFFSEIFKNYWQFYFLFFFKICSADIKNTILFVRKSILRHFFILGI